MSAAVTFVLVAAFAAPVYVAAANAESKDSARHAMISADGKEHDAAGKARIMRREVDVRKGNSSHDPAALFLGEDESHSQTTNGNACEGTVTECNHCSKHHICEHFECGFLSEETIRLYTHPQESSGVDPLPKCHTQTLLKIHCATCAEGSGKVCKANMCVADMSENDDAALMSVESMILHRLEHVADELQQTNDHVNAMDEHLNVRLETLEAQASVTTASPWTGNQLGFYGGATVPPTAAETAANAAAYQAQLYAGSLQGTCTCATGVSTTLQRACPATSNCVWQAMTQDQWQQTVMNPSQLVSGAYGNSNNQYVNDAYNNQWQNGGWSSSSLAHEAKE